MEPVTLGVIAAALVAKALDRGEDAAVDEAGGALNRIVQAVRARLSKGSPEDQDALARVEAAPDSAKQVERLGEALERQMEDGQFRTELQGLVEQANAAGVNVGPIVQEMTGSGGVQIAGVTGSSISVKTGG